MRIGALAANAGWAAMSLPAWRRFRAALRDPAGAQRRRLLQGLRRHQDTAYGRHHGFATIRSTEEYQDRVPVVGYDELEPWITRIARGEAGVLTTDRVRRLAPSSGSTAAVKLVPYTPSLQREIAGGVGVWTAELFRRQPSLAGGPAYWSVTPATGGSRPFVDDHPGSVAGHAVQIGFDDDAAYLGGARGALARRIQAVPASVRLEHDLDAFRHTTLLHLLGARELRLISVWHPSFFTGLLDVLAAEWPRLVAGVARGDRRRAAELSRADPHVVASIWPRLALVSCWADGPAAAAAGALAARLQGVALQPKGLLATEGIVTIPFGGRHPVAVDSHVFEFLDFDGRPHFAHQLERDREYTVLLTTSGGLWRYRLGDRVRVDGFVEATPSLRFVGRDDRVSDRVGEKLSDGFVAGVFERLFAGTARPRFTMLAPDEGPAGVGYVLFVESDEPVRDGLARDLERELRGNPHYAWCIDLGQLQPARVARVGPHADRTYVERCRAAGRRLGDIKPVSLHAAMDWRGAFGAGDDYLRRASR